ncbi:hypothetical protein OSJ57_23325 [Sphingomonas sp. HH69]
MDYETSNAIVGITLIVVPICLIVQLILTYLTFRTERMTELLRASSKKIRDTGSGSDSCNITGDEGRSNFL